MIAKIEQFEMEGKMNTRVALYEENTGEFIDSDNSTLVIALMADHYKDCEHEQTLYSDSLILGDELLIYFQVKNVPFSNSITGTLGKIGKRRRILLASYKREKYASLLLHQDEVWGPHRLTIELNPEDYANLRLTKSQINRRENYIEIDPEWLTPSGRWKSSEYRYLAGEL